MHPESTSISRQWKLHVIHSCSNNRMRPIMKINVIRVSLLTKLLKSDCSLRLMMMTMTMMVVGRMVIRIILGSYLQFGGCTVSIAQMCRGTSWFIHSHFSVSIAPHSSAHIVPDIVISQPTLTPALLVGCFCTWWVGGVVQGTDYWDFTPGCCPTRPTVCHTFWSDGSDGFL